MKSLKFIEESALSKNKMHEIQGGKDDKNPCYGYNYVEGCYYKNNCPLFSYGGSFCKNFGWKSDELPKTIVTYPIKKDMTSNDSIK